MRRVLMVALFVALMVGATAIPALAAALRPPVAKDGTLLPATVCESPAVISPFIGWSNEQCWVFHA